MKYVSKLRGLVSEEAGFGGFAEREMVLTRYFEPCVSKRSKSVEAEILIMYT